MDHEAYEGNAVGEHRELYTKVEALETKVALLVHLIDAVVDVAGIDKEKVKEVAGESFAKSRRSK